MGFVLQHLLGSIPVPSHCCPCLGTQGSESCAVLGIRIISARRTELKQRRRDVKGFVLHDKLVFALKQT